MGEDSRVFNGVDVTFDLRQAKGFMFSGGTSTGKVENNWCDIRAAVPESFLLNPYCNVASPWQTSLRGLVAYTVPRIDVQLSSVIRTRPNVGTEQTRVDCRELHAHGGRSGGGGGADRPSADGRRSRSR